MVALRGHPFSMYVKFSGKLTFLTPTPPPPPTPSDIQTYVCVSGGKEISVSKNFAYVLNKFIISWIIFEVPKRSKIFFYHTVGYMHKVLNKNARLAYFSLMLNLL